MKIKDIPLLERPREKALYKGIKSLSDEELLALVLQTGCHNRSALDLSRELLLKSGGLYHLSTSLISDLKIKGMGKAKILKLVSAFELGRRSLEEAGFNKTVSSSEEAVYYGGRDIAFAPSEHLKLLYLDKKKRLLRIEEMTSENPSSFETSLNELVKKAVSSSSSYVYLMHNHPSSSLLPSYYDILGTEKLSLALKAVGITLLDSLIISGLRFYSIKKRKLFEFKEEKEIYKPLVLK